MFIKTFETDQLSRFQVNGNKVPKLPALKEYHCYDIPDDKVDLFIGTHGQMSIRYNMGNNRPIYTFSKEATPLLEHLIEKDFKLRLLEDFEQNYTLEFRNTVAENADILTFQAKTPDWIDRFKALSSERYLEKQYIVPYADGQEWSVKFNKLGWTADLITPSERSQSIRPSWVICPKYNPETKVRLRVTKPKAMHI